jgi:hypothetical protein
MNISYIRALLTITALSFNEQVLAEVLTHRDYQIAKKNISDEASAAKKECSLLNDKAKNICLVNAKKGERTAQNKLNARFKKIHHLDNKISTSDTAHEYFKQHSTPKVDRLRRP